MTGRRTRLLALAACAAALSAARARAHEFKLESVMTGFVRVEAREVHLVVRLPLHVVAVKLPVAGREIDLSRADAAVEEAARAVARDITLREEGLPLAPSAIAGRLALPSDRSFDRYEDAVRRIASPLPPGTAIFAGQGYLDAHLTYPIASPGSRFSIRTAVAPELGSYLRLALRWLPPGEAGRSMVITSRTGWVSLDPAWYETGGGFVALGVEHILGGLDHLLFLLCLVIPLLGLRRVLPVVTAFTVAHSITLVGSAYGLAPSGAWFPPLVETAIALSILYMALENAVSARAARRWLVAGLFGLVHGFGFSYGLAENLQFAGRHLVVALLSFNVGIELGQLGVLAVMLPALAVLRRGPLARRAGVIVLSALVAHVAWHWTVARGEVFWKTEWPTLDAAAATAFARWVAAVLLAAGAVRFLARRAPAVVARVLRRGASAG